MNFARRVGFSTLAVLVGAGLSLAWAAEPLRAVPAARAQAVKIDFVAQRTALDFEFKTAVETLAKTQEAAGDTGAALVCREWLDAGDPTLIYVPNLPDELVPKPETGSWKETLFQLRANYAAELFSLAKEAHEGKDYRYARSLLLEAARQNPNDEKLRKLLGQTLYRDRWRTAFEKKQIEAGLVWDDRWGWLRSSFVPEYEAGKRWVEVATRTGREKGQWVGVEAEISLRKEIEKGWAIETEHFRVVTNHSHAEGVRIAKKLEELHQVWCEVFLSFWATPEQLRAMFDEPLATNAPRHEVICFRDRDEYISALGGQGGGDVGISTGVYYNATEKAYFYLGGMKDDLTILHEASHQLFSETNKRIRSVGKKANFWENRKANFWIVEGIACFMETLRLDRGRWVLGGTDSNRFRYAQYRIVNQGWFEPSHDLSDLGMNDLIKDPQVASLYAESAALVVYLLREPHRRTAMDAYLTDVYLGLDRPDSLAKRFGVEFHRLDEEFLAYLKAQPAVEVSK